MRPKNDTGAVGRSGILSKAHDHFVNNQKPLSDPNDSTEIDRLAQKIEVMMRPGKVHRLFRCFGCERHFAASRMSTALVICRHCLRRSTGKGRIARQNQIDRIINAISKHLRTRLENDL